MARYFKPAALFLVNSSFDVELVEIDGAKILIVDGFYRHPERLREHILSSPAPIWKTSLLGKNFRHYYDCRHSARVPVDAWIKAQRTIAALAREYLGTVIHSPIDRFSTNVFQLKSDQAENAIARPHHDDWALAALVGLNTADECHGGTGFYRSKFNGVLNLFDLKRHEKEALDAHQDREGLVETGADYFLHDWQAHWSLDYVAEMRFNRLVMYNGPTFHGAYHTDGHFRDHPRINHMMFFDDITFSQMAEWMEPGDES